SARGAPEEVGEGPEDCGGGGPAPDGGGIANREVGEEGGGEGDGEAGVGPLLESDRDRGKQQDHTEELGPRELHPEVGGEAEVGEHFGNLRQAQLRPGREADLEAEEGGDDPVRDRHGFRGGSGRGEYRVLNGRFHGTLLLLQCVSTPNCFAYSAVNRCQP